jgi:2-beta-glucuronyltransferase
LHDAQLIIIESGAGLLYAQSIKHQFPAAKLVYSCSDRLSTLRVHPVLQRAQQQAEELFDAIMCPAQVMTQDFKHPHCYFVPQGVDKQALDRRTQSPYAQPRNIVSVGDMLFDEAAVLMLAKLAPDWTIHLFGAGAVCTQAPTNVITHGEKPFEDIVAYIQHADIGLAPYRMADGADYLSQSSLKMKQYTYARLPIIAPNFATAGCAHAQGYDPQQLESLAGAFDKARALDRSSISTETVLSWPQVAQRILDYVL